jgi:hypothetical protein
MKTTIDLSDALFEKTKRAAAQRGTTMRALIEEGLRLVLDREPAKKPFVMRDARVKGNGLQPGIRPGDWPQLRALIYGEPEMDDDDSD